MDTTGNTTPRVFTRSMPVMWDFVERFVAACCTVGPRERTKSAILWGAFAPWLDQQPGAPLISRNNFLEVLARQGPFTSGTGRNGGIFGISVRADEEKPAEAGLSVMDLDLTL